MGPAVFWSFNNLVEKYNSLGHFCYLKAKLEVSNMSLISEIDTRKHFNIFQMRISFCNGILNSQKENQLLDQNPIKFIAILRHLKLYQFCIFIKNNLFPHVFLTTIIIIVSSASSSRP